MVNTMVERATSEMLIGPDWAMNLEISDMLNSDPVQAEDVVKGIEKRTGSRNPKAQLLALTVFLKILNQFCYMLMHALSIRISHIADAALTEKKDTPQVLFKMWKDGYLDMQKLMLTGTYQPFILWKVNMLIVNRQVLVEKFHASLNFSRRLTNELDSEKEVHYKHHLVPNEKKKKAMDKQLEFLLGLTERYSTMLAENLVEPYTPGKNTPLKTLLAIKSRSGEERGEETPPELNACENSIIQHNITCTG